MDDHFKIYIERLKDGSSEEITEVFSPEFLDVHEKELAFSNPVKVSGEAYLADDTLILHLDIDSYATLPCAICNEPVKVPLFLKGIYNAVSLDEIKGGIFNYQNLLRETILLEVPHLAECNQGNCPQRKIIQKYLKSSGDKSQNENEGYQPFANLEID